ILLETEFDLRKKPDPALHLELGLLRMVNAMRLAPLEEALSAAAGAGPATAAPARASAASPSGPGAGTGGASPSSVSSGKSPVPAKERTARLDAAPGPSPRNVSAPTGPVPATNLGAVARVAGSYQGIEAMQVESILTAVRGQTKMLETTRDAMDRLRSIASQVLGQPLRVCVKLDSAAPGSASLPARRAASS